MTDEIIFRILSKQKHNQPREYRIVLVRKPFSRVRGESGCYMIADNDDEARLKVQTIYPPDEYAILQMKQIR